MDPSDQEKTPFVTCQGTYCYRVMPFGLKNAGATYQRLVNRMLQKQIGTFMEVYIDDMLVKSIKVELHITHLAETFQVLKSYNMKLNPPKCAFGVSAGKFFGFIVNNRGIEANPDKIKIVLDMLPPSNVKDIQCLTGRIVALSCFVSRASDKCWPFFQVLEKVFQWDAHCQEAFTALKTYLSTPPTWKPFRGRTPHSLPGRFRLCNQCRTGKRTGQGAANSLLLQPSSEGSRREVPKDGKADPGIGNHIQKTPTLLFCSHS